jgi:tetrahydromethanopterin S-methyltransferase subunit A
MTEIERELCEATGFVNKKGEKREERLTRLIEAADELEDTAHDALSKPAKEWIKAAAKAMNDEKPVPDFEEEDELEEEEEKSVATKSKAKPVKGKAARSKADNGAGEAKEPKAAKPRGSKPSRKRIIQKILVKNPGATIDEIIVELEKQKEVVPSRVVLSSIRSSFKTAIETLTEMKMLVKPIHLGGN